MTTSIIHSSVVEINLKELTHSVCETAKRAGSFIREERLRFRQESIERKHAHDYVSYVDKQSEMLIVGELRTLLPQAGFITEEGSASHDREEYCWVVDPLDGTTNFIHHYPPYAVSIALMQGDDILLGVVYEICADECFYAWHGGGAFLNGAPIGVHASERGITDALLCLQLPYNSDAYKPVIKHLIEHFYGRVASIRMMGSAAVALCYVAAGRLDGYAEKYIGQWDYMAGALIVKEAGGEVSDYDGSPHFTHGDSIVATNGIIHQELLEGIKKRLTR